MNIVYLGIGSNIYPRLQYIYQALHAIEQRIGAIQKLSSIYHTEPWQMPVHTPFFYNMCVMLYTTHSPSQILQNIQSIEKEFGRVRKNQRPSVYESRCIDIDILLFNNEIISQPSLTVPHPLMHQRRFVLLPLSEIAGEVVHPVLNKQIKDLLE